MFGQSEGELIDLRSRKSADERCGLLFLKSRPPVDCRVCPMTKRVGASKQVSSSQLFKGLEGGIQMGMNMKLLSRALTAITAAALVAIAPAPSAAQEYDAGLYDTLLDCTALHILFAAASDDKAGKDNSAANAAAFLDAAQTLSGKEVGDLGSVITPRRAKILAWLEKKDPAINRLTKSCAVIARVGRNSSK